MMFTSTNEQAAVSTRSANVEAVEKIVKEIMEQGARSMNVTSIASLLIQNAETLRDALEPFDSGVRVKEVFAPVGQTERQMMKEELLSVYKLHGPDVARAVIRNQGHTWRMMQIPDELIADVRAECARLLYHRP